MNPQEQDPRRKVLVTGAGRGIGLATALHLESCGWDVYAGVRTTRDADGFQCRRITPVRLDVTDSSDLTSLPGRLPHQLDAVANNAGICVAGALESVALDDLRRVLEVNLLGQMAVTQAVIPKLRESRGRVVFVSSISGILSVPMLGPYAASKYALEAVADALRLELQPWQVPVILIEPGQIDTDLWRQAQDMLDDVVSSMTPVQQSLYAAHIAGMSRGIPKAQRIASSPEVVAAVIERSLSTRRPRARYQVGAGARTARLVSRCAPTPVRDRLVARVAGLTPHRSGITG